MHWLPPPRQKPRLPNALDAKVCSFQVWLPFIVCNIHDANLFSLQPSHSQRNHSTVIVHLPFSIKWKSDSFTIAPDCQRFPNTTELLNWRSVSTTVHDHGTPRRAA